jgi:methylated-DNA-[protein]-cysteine S-methyltransferase
MGDAGFILFDTAIGRCGLVWRAERIIGAQLPERDDATARERLARRFPQAVLEGQSRDLSHLPIALDEVTDFNRRVYEVALSIKPGETLTYGAVALRLGEAGAARAVGVALGQNPFPIIVPCHRVLAAGGRTGGFSADGGVETKLRMLTIEKARTSAEPGLFGALPLATRPR